MSVFPHGPSMAGGRLTDVEARVLRLAAAGLRADEIAEALDVSRETVAWHLARAYRKLGVRQHATPTEED
jgi:DNA-binding CsgD family transcriptional regulator